MTTQTLPYCVSIHTPTPKYKYIPVACGQVKVEVQRVGCVERLESQWMERTYRTTRKPFRNKSHLGEQK